MQSSHSQIRYIIMESVYFYDSNLQTSYGIAWLAEEAPTSILRSVPNLSPNRERVQHLVELCNDHQLDPIHLDDVIEDFLCSGS